MVRRVEASTSTEREADSATVSRLRVSSTTAPHEMYLTTSRLLSSTTAPLDGHSTMAVESFALRTSLRRPRWYILHVQASDKMLALPNLRTKKHAIEHRVTNHKEQC